MLGRLHGVARRRLQRGAIGIADVVEVGEEEHVEPAPLAHAGDVLIELGPVPGEVRMVRPRVPPHGEAMKGRPMHQELGKVDLPLALSPHGDDCSMGGAAGLAHAPQSIWARAGISFVMDFRAGGKPDEPAPPAQTGGDRL